MGDYNEKPTPNVRFSDIVGILAFCAIGLLSLYLLAMLVFHLIAGRTPG
jgi:hypothetical protein